MQVPKARVLEYFLAFFKVLNIRIIFYECSEQFFGCYESMIDERFLRVIDHAKQK